MHDSRPDSDITNLWHTEFEASVLGACIQSPDLIPEVSARLSPEDFFDPRHSAAYELIVSMHALGTVVDPITVAVELERAGRLLKGDARPFIAGLLRYADTRAGALQHAVFVMEDATRRRVHTEALGLVNAAPDAPLDELRARADTTRAMLEPQGNGHPSRLVSGGDFILAAPTDVETVWGRRDEVLWPKGEALMIAGPQGVGKTTLAQQLTLARCGMRDQLLDLPVQPDDRYVLYIAADRPRQARRSFVRMVTDDERAQLDERLIVLPGPLEFDIAAHPERLASFVADTGAGTVFIDSLKDVALDLVEDKTGSRVNAALQHVLAAGIEVVVLHHQRKAQQGGRKPKTLADVYGSTWLTSGVGSILLLWGEAGDPVVELEHKKQPAGAVGPLKLLHNHIAGTTTVYESSDLQALLRSAKHGVTAYDAARALFATSTPSRNEIEKARRKLEGAVRRDVAFRQDEKLPHGKGGTPSARYFATALGEAP